MCVCAYTYVCACMGVCTCGVCTSERPCRYVAATHVPSLLTRSVCVCVCVCVCLCVCVVVVVVSSLMQGEEVSLWSV